MRQLTLSAYASPLGGAESIHFNGIPTQCETVQLAWEGGLSPVVSRFASCDARF